ncbi:MAG: hypothetical protein ACJAZX_000344 [Rickettsiales bacterium]|jgi:hypothetical protein
MKVRIYQPAETQTQSGKKKLSWLLTPIMDSNTSNIDPIMGWTSSSDTMVQIRLNFLTSGDAEEYAKSQGWEFETILPKQSQMLKKSYADNFLQKNDQNS